MHTSIAPVHWKGLSEYSSSSQGLCGGTRTVGVIIPRKKVIGDEFLESATTIYVCFLFRW